MNARAGIESLIQVETDKYAAQITLRREIIKSDPDYYFQCPPETLPLAWEALETLLPNMARYWPEQFTLGIDSEQWTWTNHLLSETVAFTLGSDALNPLAWLGTQVQEDLILMAPQANGEIVCVGGHLCFAAGWDLGEKMGRNFLDIHASVPEFRERIGTPSTLLMQRLKPGRSVERQNWSIAASNQLNLAPKLASQWEPSRNGITPENAGERVQFRVEQQTLTRLPRTSGILFTIHTYLNPLAEVVSDPARRGRLRSMLGQFPPAMLVYKGMTPYYGVLLGYLGGDAP